MELSNKKIWVALGAVILIIVIILFTFSKLKNTSVSQVENTNTTVVKEQVQIVATSSKEIEQPATPEAAKALKESVVVVPGANPISKDNQVLTLTGVPVKNDVMPNSALAPKQSTPIAQKTELASNVIKIIVSKTGFSPNQITVNAGAPITLAFSQTIIDGHLIKFTDPLLSAVTVSLGPKETRAITFNVPEKAGEYMFKCDRPGHADRGEVGRMIVK